MTIAVTGPFASGKSAFVGMLGDLGAHTVSADEIVHDLLRWNENAISDVSERFGKEVLGEEGVDRKALGRVVFGDPEKLSELEGILHPLVHDETDRLMSFCCCEVFAVEIPLLFEAGRGTISITPWPWSCRKNGRRPGPRGGAWTNRRSGP